MKTKHLVYVALFAALIAVGAQIRIPIGPVPITFQLPMALLTGFLLGPRLGALSAFVYMCVGLVGVPVFAGGGGIGTLVSPTFGFIVGLMPAAFFAGLGQGENRRFFTVIAAGLIGLMSSFVLGFLYFMFIFNVVLGSPVSVIEALRISVLPFIIKDMIIAVLTAAFARTLYTRGLRPAI